MAAALVLALALGACGSGGDDGQVELRYTWWGNDQRAELLTEAVEMFERENPGITVATSFAEFGSYWQRLATEAAGGNPPDVMQIDYSYLREYSERGLLRDLTPYEGEIIAVDELLPGMEAAGRVGDEYFAVPVGRTSLSFQYDPEVWAEAGLAPPEVGWSWADFEGALETLQAHLGEERFPTTSWSQHLTFFENWLAQRGASLYTEDGDLGFEEADLTEYWEMVVDLQERGLVVPHDRVVAGDTVTPLGHGLSASEFGWDTLMLSTENTYGSPLALGPMPTGTDELGTYFKPSALMGVSARSEHPEEAAMLIDFLVNDPEAAALLGADRGMPATVAQQENVDLAGPAGLVGEYETSIEEHVRDTPPPPPPGGSAVERTLIRIDEEIGYGRVTVAEGVERFFADARDSLD
ncbi:MULTISPECIES: ABC transporter substrate-binding protein [Actinoalloteichus]|uniref:ABC transporter substrate-binding protein n=1 Tax=Actinoalloteichus TaxID=65496 RepID=UPI0018DEC90D|nr:MULTISPECIES: extracellular solute-binding protein [Actinoalloteichus]